MKNYTITVNGTPYVVTVEENGSSAPVANAPVSAPVAAPAPAAPSSATAESIGSVKIEAPMPGNILDVKVSVGDTVSNGQVLCILEAMKMENDISATQDGTVASINVSKGDSVEAGQVILTLN
ncbi:MAG: biotin/lipoyl-binding protein [Eubacterium sp.]|nr:biotin/lipoyl-binding protein [Eubacterium sp.]